MWIKGDETLSKGKNKWIRINPLIKVTDSGKGTQESSIRKVHPRKEYI